MPMIEYDSQKGYLYLYLLTGNGCLEGRPGGVQSEALPLRREGDRRERCTCG